LLAPEFEVDKTPICANDNGALVAADISSNFDDERVSAAAAIPFHRLPAPPAIQRAKQGMLMDAPSGIIDVAQPTNAAAHVVAVPSKFDGTPTPAVTKTRLTIQMPIGAPQCQIADASASSCDQLAPCGFHAHPPNLLIQTCGHPPLPSWIDRVGFAMLFWEPF
jgi:hypothetical protein